MPLRAAPGPQHHSRARHAHNPTCASAPFAAPPSSALQGAWHLRHMTPRTCLLRQEDLKPPRRMCDALDSPCFSLCEILVAPHRISVSTPVQRPRGSGQRGGGGGVQGHGLSCSRSRGTCTLDDPEATPRRRPALVRGADPSEASFVIKAYLQFKKRPGATTGLGLKGRAKGRAPRCAATTTRVVGIPPRGYPHNPVFNTGPDSHVCISSNLAGHPELGRCAGQRDAPWACSKR